MVSSSVDFTFTFRDRLFCSHSHVSWAQETLSWLSVKVIPKLKILGAIYQLPLFLNGEVVKKSIVFTGTRLAICSALTHCP